MALADWIRGTFASDLSQDYRRCARTAQVIQFPPFALHSVYDSFFMGGKFRNTIFKTHRQMSTVM
jgi:hypothetical protein